MMSALDDAVQQYRSGKQKDARAELAALRVTLQSWFDLWSYICKATNCAGYLPNEQNFDSMLDNAPRYVQLRATIEAQERKFDQARNWHPVGFARDPLASRGWGTLIESVSGNAVTFEELVSRYNSLVFAANTLAPQAQPAQETTRK